MSYSLLTPSMQPSVPRPFKWASTAWLHKEYERLRHEPPVKTTWHRTNNWFFPNRVYPGSEVWHNPLFADAISIHFELCHRAMFGEPERPKGWDKIRIEVDPRFAMPLPSSLLIPSAPSPSPTPATP